MGSPQGHWSDRLLGTVQYVQIVQHVQYSLYLSISISLHLSISIALSLSLSLYMSPRGTQKAPMRLPRYSQEAPRTPRRLPEGSQEAPRRHPGGSQGNQSSKRPLREGRVILYLFLHVFMQKFFSFVNFTEGFQTSDDSRRIFTSINGARLEAEPRALIQSHENPYS